MIRAIEFAQLSSLPLPLVSRGRTASRHGARIFAPIKSTTLEERAIAQAAQVEAGADRATQIIVTYGDYGRLFGPLWKYTEPRERSHRWPVTLAC
jgi:hypothetical protein